MTKQRIEIEADVPDGWVGVAYRSPLSGEWYLGKRGPGLASCDYVMPWLILRKVEPKRHKRTLSVAWRADDLSPRSFETREEARNYVANFPQHKWAGITGPHEIEFTEGEGLEPLPADREGQQGEGRG